MWCSTRRLGALANPSAPVQRSACASFSSSKYLIKDRAAIVSAPILNGAWFTTALGTRQYVQNVVIQDKRESLLTRRILDMELLLMKDRERLTKEKWPTARLIRLLKHAALAKDTEKVLELVRLVRSNDTWVHKKLYNTILAALSDVECHAEAVETFNFMASRSRLKPDAVSYTILMKLQGGNWKKLLSVLEMMIKNEVRPDLYTFNTLIHACCTSQEPEEALKLLERMKLMRIRPDVVTYTTLIDSLIRSGNLAQARNKLYEMNQDSVTPNEATYTSLIKGSIDAGNTNQAFHMLDEMQNTGLKLTTRVLTQALTALLSQEDYENAYKVYERMEQEGTPIDSQAANEVVKVLSSLGKITRIMPIIKRSLEETQIKLGSHFFETLRKGSLNHLGQEDHVYCLQYMRDQGYLEEGMQWYEHMLAHELPIDDSIKKVAQEIYQRAEIPVPAPETD